MCVNLALFLFSHDHVVTMYVIVFYEDVGFLLGIGNKMSPESSSLL